MYKVPFRTNADYVLPLEPMRMLGIMRDISGRGETEAGKIAGETRSNPLATREMVFSGNELIPRRRKHFFIIFLS
jgi:hypothetical protein